MRTLGRTVVAAMVTCTLVILLVSLGAADDTDRYSDWSPPVNLGTPINQAGFVEQNATLSKNGLSLYFQCMNCPGGFGGTDIWVAQRPSVDAPWGAPVNLGPSVNTPFSEGGPNLSADGHRLYFQSNRPGGFGLNDLYVSRRHNKREDFGWQLAVNLGPGVNSAFAEMGAADFEDDATGILVLYFSSSRPGGLGDTDVYASTLQPDGTFGQAELVVELSSASMDGAPAIRRDGLEMFLNSNRAGSFGAGVQGLDIWVSTRASTTDPWSPPVNLGATVNSALIDGGPSLSFDGTALHFYSTRGGPGASGPCNDPSGPCVFDLWVTTRTKLKGPSQ